RGGEQAPVELVVGAGIGGQGLVAQVPGTAVGWAGAHRLQAAHQQVDARRNHGIGVYVVEPYMVGDEFVGTAVAVGIHAQLDLQALDALHQAGLGSVLGAAHAQAGHAVLDADVVDAAIVGPDIGGGIRRGQLAGIKGATENDLGIAEAGIVVMQVVGAAGQAGEVVMPLAGQDQRRVRRPADGQNIGAGDHVGRAKTASKRGRSTVVGGVIGLKTVFMGAVFIGA